MKKGLMISCILILGFVFISIISFQISYRETMFLEHLKKQPTQAQTNQSPAPSSSHPKINVDPLIAKLLNKVKNKRFPKNVEERVTHELMVLLKSQGLSEASFERISYLEHLIDLPWEKSSNAFVDLKFAEGILEKSHAGLQKIKEEILEYIAVKMQLPEKKGKVLLLIGPPGVGKTTIAKSIAKSLGRKFYRVSLGGVSDVAKIRGWSRSYKSATPGDLVQALQKTGVNNPVILLDEVDKIAPRQQGNGDPEAALLEALDPEQNHDFKDNFLGLGVDLSNVIFIATANTSDISRPLKDRMETIQIEGYTAEEKFTIAKQHLLPKEMKSHRLTSQQFMVDDAVIKELIKNYTMEAGVRALTSCLEKLARKATLELASNPKTVFHVTLDNFKKILDKDKVRLPRRNEVDQVGVANGLWANDYTGGTTTIETIFTEGKGDMVTTGNLGKTLNESIQAAMTCLKANQKKWNIPAAIFKKDIHVHLTEAGIKKEGPSAGIAIFSALYSSATGKKIRADVALTGEVSLNGLVSPIGGVQKKVEGAIAQGIKKVVLPKDNEEDFEKIPQSLKDKVKVAFVENVDQVVHHVAVP